MKHVKPPTKEFLRECFTYKDGKLYWKERPRHHFSNEHGWKIFNGQVRKNKGKPAGSINPNYVKNRSGPRRTIQFTGCSETLSSRLIWIFHYGEIEKGKFIDHIDGDSLNDRIENLRCVDHLVNRYNSKKYSRNTSGYTGVSWMKSRSKYRARGQSDDGKQITLYYGDNFDEALKARKEWEANHPHMTDRHGK